VCYNRKVVFPVSLLNMKAVMFSQFKMFAYPLSSACTLRRLSMFSLFFFLDVYGKLCNRSFEDFHLPKQYMSCEHSNVAVITYNSITLGWFDQRILYI